MKFLKFSMPLAVLLIANIFVFGGVYWNQSGTPTGTIYLNDCGLGQRGGYFLRKHDRFLSLAIVSEPVTVTGLEDPDRAKYGTRERALSSYVLVRQGGPEWDKFVAREKSRLKTLETRSSKLIYTDSSPDLQVLIDRQSSTDGEAILRGSIRKRQNTSEFYPRALTTQISIDSKFRQHFEEIAKLEKARKDKAKDPQSCVPQFEITVNWGRRYDPWISSVSKL
ncbi:DUF4824 family protein [Sneathiella marina]|uniref:DUF4824 family protein n=1 Tax=Sneathiella marina TaxID=2950108 RepID=A0ABY4WBN8_9PROT|nr:DUF4824 family protein [Sneathiella marina]USG62659.1 DUF4824 family protein [Sneathiella marina]